MNVTPTEGSSFYFNRIHILERRLWSRILRALWTLRDAVVLADIYAAREVDNLGVSSQTIANQMQSSVEVRGTPMDAAGRTREIIEDGDVVLVLGAGDVVQVAAQIAGMTQ